ncbi:MAG: hypothetical protein ACKO2P_10865 [Planctomycetota bacterium]
MRMPSLRFISAVVRCLQKTVLPGLFLSSAASAQLPPGAGYVFPPAVSIGRTTDVQLGVFDPTDDVQWFVHDTRVQLERTGPVSDFHLPPPPYWTGPRGGTNALPIPREAPARITVAADVQPGFVYWQIASANGSSRTARMLLSHDPEILESRSRDFPQQLPALPVAVSGRLSRLTEVDRYEIVASSDGPITVQLMARELGADFRGILQARDAGGALLADFADTQGMDGSLTFSVRTGQRYSVSLHDVDFRGDRAYIYRLLFTQTPHVVTTIPARLQRGATADVEFVGSGLQSGLSELQSVRQSITAPADPQLQQHSINLQSPGGSVPVTMPLSSFPELAAGPGQSSDIPVPGAITSRLTPEHPEQRFLFTAVKDQPLQVSLQSVGIGSSLDTQLTILTPEGTVAAENDDADGLTDSLLEFKPAADGRYTAVIRSQSLLNGRVDEVFRVEVRPPAADFSLTIPQQLSLPSAGQLEVAITARRSGGFDGPIAVQVTGLPAGVTAEGDWSIPAGKTDVKGILKSAPDAAVTAAAIQVSGTADVGGTAVTRLATATAAGNLCPRISTQKLTTTALLAMTMTPPIDVLVIDRERQRDVPRGSTCPAELEIVRKNGFTGPVTLVMSAQQARNRQGIRGTTTIVPPGESRALFPCFMPEWLATDITRRMVVHGVVDVPDPKGTIRQLTKPGDARITMIMEGALLKLACEVSDLRTVAGGTFEVPVSLSRSPRLTAPVTIALLVPEEAAGLLSAEPLVLTPEQSSGRLRMTTTADPRLLGPWQLRLAASTLLNDRWPVVSEAVLDVEIMPIEQKTGAVAR